MIIIVDYVVEEEFFRNKIIKGLSKGVTCRER